jgi:hypothetical protein
VDVNPHPGKTDLPDTPALIEPHIALVMPSRKPRSDRTTRQRMPKRELTTHGV